MKTLNYLPDRIALHILLQNIQIQKLFITQLSRLFTQKFHLPVYRKTNNHQNIFVIFLIASQFIFQACATKNSILKSTRQLESRGLYCEAISSELIALAEEYSPERDEVLERVGAECVEISIYQANTMFSNGNTPTDYENALKKCNEARQKINVINSDFNTSILLWKKEYQMLEERIKQSLLEAYYKEANVFYNQDNFSGAVELFDKIIVQNPNYKNAAELRKTSYNAITEQLYKTALAYFTAKNYNSAILKSDELISRDAGYKDIQKIRTESYEAITEEIYSKGMSMYLAENYETAYSNMNNVINRNPSYKEAFRIRKESYDKISEILYNKAMSLYYSKNYKVAYQEFRHLSHRDNIHIIYPHLNETINECKEKAIIKFYIEGEPSITNEVYRDVARNSYGSDLVQFVGSSSQADYVVVISSEVIHHSPKTERTPKTGYRIRRWKEETIDNTTKPPNRITRYRNEAIETVVYYEVQKQYSVTSVISYTIRGSNKLGEKFETTKRDCLVYNECNQVGIGDLLENRQEATDKELKPSEYFMQKFIEPIPKTNEELRNESYKYLIGEMTKKIKRDINQIIYSNQN